MTESHPRVYRALKNYLGPAAALELMIGARRGHRDALAWLRTLCWGELRRQHEMRHNTQETAP